MLARLRVLLIAVAMISSVPVIFLQPPRDFGSDFRGVHNFHHCETGNHPYAPIVVCDPRGWAMPYPPLLYWSMAWMRWLDFDTAYAIWAAISAGGIVLAARAWGASWPFALGLWLLFPTGFALKTGNNDIGVLLLWCLVWMFWQRSAWFWCGVFAGAAAAYKLYPAIALALLVGWAWRHAIGWQKLIAGATVAIVVQAVVFAADWLVYPPVLARHAQVIPDPSWYAHSVPALAGRVAPLIIVGLFAMWATVSAEWIVAGALAISTYAATQSYDYNLITTYPLLASLSVAARRPDAPLTLTIALVAGLLVVGHRNLIFVTDRGQVWPSILQIVWLATLPIVLRVGRRERGQRDSGDPRSRFGETDFAVRQDPREAARGGLVGSRGTKLFRLGRANQAGTASRMGRVLGCGSSSPAS